MDTVIAWSVLIVLFGCLAVLAWMGDLFETRHPRQAPRHTVRFRGRRRGRGDD